jgi:tight adherence protein B
MLNIIIIMGVIAFVLLIFGIIVSLREERSLVEERLGRYLEAEMAERSVPGSRTAPLTDWLNTQTERFAWGEMISKELARADLKFKVGEFMILVGIAILVGAGLFWFFFDQNLIMTLVGAIIGAYVPRVYVRMQQSRRLVRFGDQLSDMLNLMVNGLRAGYSTMQAMEAVSKELPPPICDEFRRVVQEMQLGVPMERTLDNLVRRIPSTDLDLVITAINVQREVGGNLAEILDTISHTIRERVRIKGEIRVLTAQVMYSGRFLAIMPILLFGAMYGLNKTYVMRFFAPENRILGLGALGLAALLIVFGYLSMNRIGKIDV